MTENAYIVGIPGSLAADSATRTATRYVLQHADRRDVDTTLLDLREYDLPVYGADRRPPHRSESPGGVRSPARDERSDPSTLRATVAAADAVVLGSPMYHGSVSSPLKAALDHCTREEFDDTPVGLLAVAGGRFPRPLLTHLREIALALGARPLASEVAISRSGSTVEDGRVVDTEVRDRLDALADELVRYIGCGEVTDREYKLEEETDSSSESGETAVGSDHVDGPTTPSR